MERDNRRKGGSWLKKSKPWSWLSRGPKGFKKKWPRLPESSGKKRKRRYPVAGYGSKTWVYHPLARVLLIHYTPELPLDRIRIIVYNIGTMITRDALRNSHRILRTLAFESFDDCRFYHKAGKLVEAAKCRGRYQAYFDSCNLINGLMNPTKKGGD